MLSIILFAFVIGFIANVYHGILAHEEVLNFWFRFGARYQGRWFWKPIWGCPLCISGQWALWYYIFRFISHKFFAGAEIFLLMGNMPNLSYNALEGLIFILITIGASKIFQRVLND